MTKEKLETALYNAIILLNDNIADGYNIDSEYFVKFICVNTGISEEEYKKIMMLDDEIYTDTVVCENCKYLKVINDGKVYAKCLQTDFEFMPFGTDTRTHFCGFGEKRKEKDKI